jgi:nitrous oxide reductase accessory protein NosL
MKLFVPLIIGLLFSVSLAATVAPIKPTEKDKCPVCGMFVYKYPDFISEIIFRDGSYAVFDGAKDMFKYYFNFKKYDPKKKVADIVSLYVTDYYTLTLVNGFKAYYVLGSDICGPMGRELIPFEKEADAKEFSIDHKGKSIKRFKDISYEMIKGLD